MVNWFFRRGRGPFIGAAVLTASLAGFDPVISGQSRRVYNFIYSFERDAFDDSDLSRITTQARDGNTGYYSNRLGWQCLDGLKVFMDWTWAVSRGAVLVRYRFDRNEASEPEYWRVAELGETRLSPSLLYQREENVAKFTSQARGAESVLVEVTDPEFGSHRLRFDVARFPEAFRLLTCSAGF